VPNYEGRREKWVGGMSPIPDSVPTKLLGEPCRGYSISPFYEEKEYRTLLDDLARLLGSQGSLFTLLDEANANYFFPIYRAHNIARDLSERGILGKERQWPRLIDISVDVAALRREKDATELSLITQAIEITCKAQRTVAQYLAPGQYEYELQAEVERVYTRNRATIAFPSIVATGKNSTILHYMVRDQKLADGDLLVLDIGAEYNYYCADITRTYPVSGKFSARQREVYDIVLATQAHVADVARPGMFLNNAKTPESSLHHIAVSFLQKEGMERYFVHGIGHFLGLDVHDVGDIMIPLKVGDVFTIEPGLYIPEENIGIRIEDDFVMTDRGATCLSAALPKKAEEIEAMMQ